MRSGGTFILTSLLILAIAKPLFASGGMSRQGYELRSLSEAVWLYHQYHNKYPFTDDEGTWYQKLKAAKVYYSVRTESSSGELPLDFYGYPLVFEPPGPTNGNQIVIRAIGQNGIDDGGALDDWDSRFGPNLGYWYKRNWPAAYRRAWICGVLALIGLIFITIRVNGVKAKVFFAALWIGLLSGVVMPIGFDSVWGRSSASIDPYWIMPVSGIGALLVQLCILAFIVHSIHSYFYRRHLRITGTVPCTKCSYYLRGTIAANIDRCPECGEPVDQ